ncbi:MAG: acyl-CoA dehydrogenase family protein [Leptospiraceae bacterium]|nr:acyl-CoA dehydrogenase family protein [Leptospiraceae bacterium]
MIAKNYFSEDEDLKLMFERLVDWPAVVKEVEGEDFAHHQSYQKTGDELYAMAPSSVEEAVEFYRSSLEALGDFCGKEIAQASATLDQAGLRFEDGVVNFPDEAIKLFETFRDTGLLPYAIPREGGGLQMPAVMWAFVNFLLTRSDVSFSMLTGLANLAQIVTRYGTDDQIQRFAKPMAMGQHLFAMALTEPDYGSDLGNCRTVATKQPDGSYRLNGTKRFISQGCGIGPYPAIMITLARTGQSGARGLSAFLVRSSDAQIGGIEKKIGIHASPTCEVVLEDTPGELIAEEGQGLTKCTIGMTSFMRLISASGGPGGACAAHAESKKYASERIQFGKTIDQIPAVADMLDMIRRETTAMRLMCLETGVAIDKYQHRQIRLEKQGLKDRDIRKDETIQHWSRLAAFFTSLAKYYCSEKGMECTSVALQIHGGAGYTNDYDVSRMFRDARVNTIYEGTSQLHVGISVAMVVAGMAGDGYLRRYFDGLLADIPKPGSLLTEIREILDTAIPLYRALSDGVRERFAEQLVLTAARYMCSLVFERATAKLGEETPAHWFGDREAFHLDSLAVAQAALTRIKNAEKVYHSRRETANAQ